MLGVEKCSQRLCYVQQRTHPEGARSLWLSPCLPGKGWTPPASPAATAAWGASRGGRWILLGELPSDGKRLAKWNASRSWSSLTSFVPSAYTAGALTSFPEGRTDCGTRVGAGSEVFLCSPGLSGDNMNMNLWGFGFGFVGAFWSY